MNTIAVSRSKRGRPTKDLSKLKFGRLLPKELEYRLATQKDFRTSPLIVAHHKSSQSVNPFEEVRNGRIVLIKGLESTIETLEGTSSESDAQRIIDSYVRHGLLYGISNVTAEIELNQLRHSHHLSGPSIFKSVCLF